MPDQSRSSFQPKNGLTHLRAPTLAIISGETFDMAMTPMMSDVSGENRELHHFGDDDADHAALDRVERRERPE